MVGIAMLAIGGCAWAPPPFLFPLPLYAEKSPESQAPLAIGWQVLALPGAAPGRMVQVLHRQALAAPMRYQVIVVPGSGCTGFAPLAEPYFAGLLHAQVWVLHKPGADLQAGAAPPQCPPGFEAGDALSRWQADAVAAVRALPHIWDRGTPTLLIGISEGAELLPGLALALVRLDGLVLLSASGLDPVQAGALQAARQGDTSAWLALAAAQAGDQPDSAMRQGRSLRYWRDLWRWSLAKPLIEGPWPLVQVWGAVDEKVPAEAYEHFAQLAAQGRIAPWCTHRFADADHGLQSKNGDALQQVWAWTEQWARVPQEGLCAPVRRWP